MIFVVWFVLYQLAAFTVASSFSSSHNEKDEEALVEYLIVGAGGAIGLQLALFFEAYGHSYKILEQNNVVGSFWNTFPVFDELISVNKRLKNQTQSWRYDWHSLLEAPLRMANITKRYFPYGHEWQNYMAAVAQRANLKIEFGVHVEQIAADHTPCVFVASSNHGKSTKRCAQRRVFVGTGLQEKDEPLLRAMGGIPYSKVTHDMATDRRVCILGNGNAGFETASNLYGVADCVILMGKHPFRLSSVTRYTGDIRVKFLQVLENFHGKLLDTVLHWDDVDFPFFHLIEEQELADGRPLMQTPKKQASFIMRITLFILQYDCELMVLATGFRSQVPGWKPKAMERLPPMTSQLYTSTSNDAVHYIGWHMHQADFRRGAGGFLSGYRYLIRNLVHHIRELDLDSVQYPRLRLTSADAVAAHVVLRVQSASGLIILQDGVVLRDVIVPILSENGANHYEYYEGITYSFHRKLMEKEDIISLYFAWGDGRDSRTVFDSITTFEDNGKLINLFLHPVIETRGLVRHMVEDLDMEWNHQHVVAVDTVIRQALAGDLSNFETKQAFPFKTHTRNTTASANTFEEVPKALKLPVGLCRAIWASFFYNFHPHMLDIVREHTKATLPKLFDFSLLDSNNLSSMTTPRFEL